MSPNQTTPSPEFSIVMPCLNESKTLGRCIDKALASFEELGIEGEVIVADNGSTDGSIEIARSRGVRVVPVTVRGYGAALSTGIAAARGTFVIMGDADDTYDFSNLRPFVESLRAGYDLVQGNRFKGGIEPGAMPPAHRYFGNPLLSALGRRLFRCPEIGDFYCGLRGFRKEAIDRLQIQSSGMEFALEMIVKAGMRGLKIKEVPTTLSKDAKDRVPHLRTYRDGWRSLRFFLTMSPHWVFTLPGLVFLLAGLVGCVVLFPGPVRLGDITLDYHTLIYASAAVVIGYQGLLLGTFAKLMAAETGLHPHLTRLGFLRERAVMERLLGLAALLLVIGCALGVASFLRWASFDFGNLGRTVTVRLVVGSSLGLVLGIQTLMAAFFYATLNMLVERHRRFHTPVQS